MDNIADERGEYRNPIAHGTVFAVVSFGCWLLIYGATGWPTILRVPALLWAFVLGMGIFWTWVDTLRRREWGRSVTVLLGTIIGSLVAQVAALSFGLS